MKTDGHISLKTLLNLTATTTALLSFFMGQELIGAPYALAFLALLGAAILIEWRDLPHPPRLFVNLATLAALLLIFARIRRNYTVEAFMEALLLMTAVKMLEKKESRDYLQIVALSLAIVVAYAMLSVEKTFIVYCFGMALLSTLTLILSAWFAREREARLSLRELRQVLVRTAVLFGMMFPLSLLLFFGAPRVAAPLFGMRGQYGSTVTGFSDQVQLGDATAIQRNNRLAFRVATESLSPRTPYWRGSVLDLFEGRMWIASRRGRERPPFIPEAGAQRIIQEISLEPGNRGYLFALDQPLSVSGIDATSVGDGIYQYRSGNVGRRLQYNAVSILSTRMKPINPVFDKKRYLSLPQDFIPRLQSVVTDLTRGMNDREKAEAVMRYLSPPDFTYALEGLPSAVNALEYFIFTGRTGNCEYFASAMGVMLRMAGVPARLVSGYRGGIYNEAGGYYIVQEEQAHIWVEAWDEAEKAWVRYDPTPAGVDAGGDTLNTWELYLDMLDYQWSKLVVNYNWEIQTEMLQNLRTILRNPRASLSPTRDGMLRLGSALSVPIYVLLGAAACFAVPAFVRRLRGRKPEMILLHRFLHAMKRHGYEKDAGEGLEEFLARIDDKELRTLALPFVRRFEEFYFRDRTPDRETRRFLQKEIDKVSRYEKPASRDVNSP